MVRTWTPENISKLITNSERLNIYELCELFEGQFNQKQIKNKIDYLGLARKKVETRKFVERRPQPERTRHNAHFFDDIDTKEKAYALGLWVADGWLTTKNYQVGFCNNEIDLVDLFRNLLESDHKIYKREVKKANNYRLIIGSKLLHSGLINLGFNAEKSSTAKYPLIAKEFDSHFIRGVFDGDGCITRNLRAKDKIPELSIRIAGTLDLMRSMNEKIPGSAGQIYKEKRHQDWFSILRFSVRKSLLFCQWIYNDSEGLRLERKYQRYIDYRNKSGFYAKDFKVNN